MELKFKPKFKAKISKKPEHPTTMMRVWISTRDKLNTLAKHSKMPRTQFLDSLCDQLLKHYGLQESQDDSQRDNEVPTTTGSPEE